MVSCACLFCCLVLVQNILAYKLDHVDDTRALIYLMKYGYVESDKGNSALVNKETLKSIVSTAVMDFQAFAGLDQTGEIDQVTKELMETPRCGVRDIIGHGATARRKRR